VSGVWEVDARCPYCGEPIKLLIDCSVTNQEYIEDCEICCRPITVHVAIDEDGAPVVRTAHENG